MLFKIFKTLAASFFIRKLLKNIDFFFFRNTTDNKKYLKKGFTYCTLCSNFTRNSILIKTSKCMVCSTDLAIYQKPYKDFNNNEKDYDRRKQRQ